MQTLRFSLFVLLAFAAGCRDLGNYLSPDEVKSCIEGTQVENCPEGLEPTAAVTFRLPAIAPGSLNPEATSRFVTVQATVTSSLEIDRVDLQCGGLQLASWRPGRVKEFALDGTVDLLPCRTSATERAADASGVVLHEVPLEVAVFDALGARVLLGDLRVLANLADTRLPGADVGVGPDATLLTLEVLQQGSPVSGVLPAGVALEARIRSVSGVPLSEPPQLRLNGIRLDVTFTSADQGVAWTGEIPPLSPPPAGAATLAQALQAPLASLSVLGAAEGSSAGIRLQTYPMERVSHVLSSLPLGAVDFMFSAGPPALEPVATTDGTLFLDWNGTPQLFRPNGTLQGIEAPPTSSATIRPTAFTALGGVLWQSFNTGGGLVGNFLQQDLGQAPIFNTVPGFDGEDRNKLRLGNGSICMELLLPDANRICGIPPLSWTFSCIGPGTSSADQMVETLTYAGGADLGPPDLHAPLESGWISTAYNGIYDTCLPPQAVGLWNDTARILAFGPTYVPPTLINPNVMALVAGPSHAVIGHAEDGKLQLERLNGEAGVPGSAYFGSLSGMLRPSIDDVLFALPDGGVVTLSPSGVLSKWLPGSETPASTFDLFMWAGGPLSIPNNLRPSPGGEGQRIKGMPRVVHTNGNVTFALIKEDHHAVVLEVDSSLRPVWAWEHPNVADGAIAVYGVPDGASVDVFGWEMMPDANIVTRLSRARAP